jgi:ferritin-like metal-binding protein YciE
MPKQEKLTSLANLYVHELKDIYSAEKQITKALPKMIKAAESEELKASFEEHLEVTQEQISRLEEILERMGEKPTGPKCQGMEGLLKESDEFLKEEAEPPVLDAGIIVGAQKVEHYEIAAYGSLCTFAQMLEKEDDLELLTKSLEEEKETDSKLTEIAESTINQEAEDTETEEEGEEEGEKATASSGSKGRSKR